VARIIKILSSKDEISSSTLIGSQRFRSLATTKRRAPSSAFCARQFAGSSNGDLALTYVSQFAATSPVIADTVVKELAQAQASAAIEEQLKLGVM